MSPAAELREIIRTFSGGSFEPWEESYLALHARRFAETVALLPPAVEGNRLLDVGIFPGHIAALAQARGFTVSGISNEEMNPQFREQARRAGFTIRQSDVEREPFPFDEAAFDVVVCSELIEHMSRDPFHVLAEIFRVLRPGGALVVTTPNLARLPVVLALLAGNSPQPPLAGPLDESFPLNPNYGHVREYTARELEYLLLAQDKRLYRFETLHPRHSGCWDPLLRDVLRALRHRRAGARTLFTWLAQSVFPGSRSCLMVSARKPLAACWVPSDSWTDARGLFDLERDTPEPGLTRRMLPAPFRWTSAAASWSFRNPAPGRASRLLLSCGYLAPTFAPEVAAVFRVNGQPALETVLRPAKTFRVVEVPLPDGARRANELRLEIACGTWSPKALGFDDARDLGLIVAWDRLLLL